MSSAAIQARIPESPVGGPVVDPLADDPGRLEARVAVFDSPAEDLLVEGGGGVDVARRDLQVADLAVREPGALLAHPRAILGAGSSGSATDIRPLC